MNYLAHLYLADSTPASLIGNLIADFIKGRDLGHLPVGIQQGVHVHRVVDSFTDRHPTVLRSIARLSRNWSWYAMILVDVYYDHVLSTTWDNWSSEPLRAFVDRVHHCLSEHSVLIPNEGREMVGKLIATDRLWSYTTNDGIRDSLCQLSRRVRERLPKTNVHLELAMPCLREHHRALSDDFAEFFPELIRHVDSIRGKDGMVALRTPEL